ncbi:MAG: family 1 glycosylhydrolase, partial [Spirochaetota bacterium]
WDYITTGIDFLGVNNYTLEFAYHVWYIPLLHTWMTGGDIAEAEYEENGRQYTSMGWEVFPRGIYDVLMRLKNEYGNPPVLVTENGAAFDDAPPVDGRVDDEKRIQFLNGYLHMIAQALQDGADVRGYFVWSLLDNFEWSVGFTKRFGIVYVNYETLERTNKDSGFWYMDFIKSQKNRQDEGRE